MCTKPKTAVLGLLMRGLWHFLITEKPRREFQLKAGVLSRVGLAGSVVSRCWVHTADHLS